jgi:thioredoxin 1
MKNIVELTNASFEPEVLQAAGPVVVDFYAPCGGACKMLAPLLEQLAGELDGRVKFAKANVNDLPDVTAHFNVTGVPTLILFRDGRNVGQVVGLTYPRDLKTWLEKAAAEPAPAWTVGRPAPKGAHSVAPPSDPALPVEAAARVAGG